MDSSGLQCSTSIPSNKRREKEDPAMIQSERAKFFATYQPQEFSLPDSIMFYLATNPTSPESYEKMIQICKYFFFKNPILVLSELSFFGDGKWKLFFNKRPIDLSKITSKIWIIDELFAHRGNCDIKKAVNQNILSSLMPKLYQCNAKTINFKDQNITFHDLLLIISSAEVIFFQNVIVQNKDGSNVAVEKIVEVAVNAKNISFWSNTYITLETMKNLIKLPHFSKLDRLILYQIPEAFDLETFYSYMKKNKSTKFQLFFHGPISEAYKNRLENIVDEILATETRGYKPPCILFAGLDFEKYYELQRIYYSQ